jgi:hypothetical protein
MTRRRWARGLLIAAAVVLVMLVVVRVIADPLATRAFRRRLATMEDFEGRVAQVHLGFFPPAISVRDLALTERAAPPRREPTLFVERVRSALSVRALLRGQLVAEQWVIHPKLTLRAPLTAQAPERAARQVRAKAPDLLAAIRRLPPTRVNRVHIEDAELLVVDVSEPERPRLWAHGLRGELYDLQTRPQSSQPATISFHGLLQRTGKVRLRLTSDPAPERLNFHLHAAIEGLALSDLSELLEAKADAHATRGTLTSVVDLESRRGQLSGTVKTEMHDVDVKTAHHSLGDRLKAWLADKSFDLVATEAPAGQTAQATLPIRGTLGNPDAPIGATVLHLVRSAFVRGLSHALGGGEAAVD